MRRLNAGRDIGMLLALALAAGASPARATVRPPSDSLTVEIRWLDQSGPTWHTRLRLLRYTTTGSAPGAVSTSELALRATDSLAVTGADSALIVMRGTQIPMPGFAALAPSAAAATALKGQPGATAGGIWVGALGVAPNAVVLPNRQVDVCWFLAVRAGTADSTLARVVNAMKFGSATANPGGVPSANVAFKGVTRSRRFDTGGGGGIRKTHDF